ncbi:MAG: hypothetical protein QNJ13_12850 [Paracoccaceae bacterium]|nr:hypothetical protein [Paracoccaceae bacterium]
MAQAQRDGFDSRIDRIRTGNSPNVMGRVEVGPREEIRANQQGKRKVRKVRMGTARPAESLGSLMFTVPMALLIGALSFFAGRVAAFHLFTGQGMYQVDLPVWRIDLWGDIAIAAILALLLAWTLKLNHGLRRTALLLGFAGMMSGELLLMQEYPEVFERFYTPSYVTAAAAEPFYLF